jgi:phosphatidylinositol kinase/protein kinase (PI-3  family)
VKERMSLMTLICLVKFYLPSYHFVLGPFFLGMPIWVLDV